MRYITEKDDNKFILMRDGTVEQIKTVIAYTPSLLSITSLHNGQKFYRMYTGRGKVKEGNGEKDIIQISPINLWN